MKNLQLLKHILVKLGPKVDDIFCQSAVSQSNSRCSYILSNKITPFKSELTANQIHML